MDLIYCLFSNRPTRQAGTFPVRKAAGDAHSLWGVCVTAPAVTPRRWGQFTCWWEEQLPPLPWVTSERAHPLIWRWKLTCLSTQISPVRGQREHTTSEALWWSLLTSTALTLKWRTQILMLLIVVDLLFNHSSSYHSLKLWTTWMFVHTDHHVLSLKASNVNLGLEE